MEEVDFDHTSFWLNVIRLPKELYTKEVAKKVAKNFKDVSSIQIRKKEKVVSVCPR